MEFSDVAWFQCFIRGENFPGALAATSGLVGFYTTRFVEATDAAEAESLALGRLRDEPKLAPPPGYQPEGIASVSIEEIEEIKPDSVPAQEPGFVWYPMERMSWLRNLAIITWRIISGRRST